MPTIVLQGCDITQPVINAGGYGTFSLTVTLSGAPPVGSPVEVDVTGTPSSELTLNSPYYFTEQEQEIDVVTSDVVTTTISPIVQVSCGGVSLCFQMYICPTGTSCSPSVTAECTGS